MAGRNFVFTNRKGGTGKSTDATNFTLYLQEQKRQVIFLDLDPRQKDGAAFFQGRQEHFPDHPKVLHYVFEDPAHVERAINEAMKSGADVVCDCAPLDPPAVVKAIELADALIYPFQAGGNDMRAVGRALALAAAKIQTAEEQGLSATPPQLFALINKFKPRHINDKSLKRILEQSGVFHYLGGVGDRNEIRDSVPQFMAVWEYEPSSQGAAEMLTVFNGIHRSVK